MAWPHPSLACTTLWRFRSSDRGCPALQTTPPYACLLRKSSATFVSDPYLMNRNSVSSIPAFPGAYIRRLVDTPVKCAILRSAQGLQRENNNNPTPHPPTGPRPPSPDCLLPQTQTAHTTPYDARMGVSIAPIGSRSGPTVAVKASLFRFIGFMSKTSHE